MSIWRRAAVLLGVGALLSMMVGGVLPAAAGPRTGEHQTFTYTIPGDAVFPEGVAVDRRTGFFYVGSTTDGTIFRGRLGWPSLAVFLPGGADGRSTAIGMKVDRSGRLYVAGGATGQAWVYDTANRRLVRHFDTGLRQGTFLNDIAITPSGDAYVTDSLDPVLWRLPATAVRRPDPTVASPEAFIDFTGTAVVYQAGFNLNGIWPSADGRRLVVVQSNTGQLFRIAVPTRRVAEISVAGGPLTAGDGILLAGRKLLVSRNAFQVIDTVALDGDLASGRVTAEYTDSTFMYPTTIALARSRVLIVDSQFDRRSASLPPVLPFTISSVPLARVLAGS